MFKGKGIDENSYLEENIKKSWQPVKSLYKLLLEFPA
jgi:hypothetical protein